MPLLARAKRNVGHKLNSSATVSEASQNMICAYLSIALLVGLLANALARLVVGRSDCRARDRRGRRQGRRRELAWRNLRVLLDLAVVEGGDWSRGASWAAISGRTAVLRATSSRRSASIVARPPRGTERRDSGTSGLLGVEDSVAYGLVITTHTSPSCAAIPRGLCPTGISASFDAVR